MQFRLLGPLEVVDDDDRSLALGGRKQRSVLAVLLLHANDVVATERLVDEVWGDAPPATVGKSIQVYVSRMRKQFGDGRLVTRAPGYALHVDPSELDPACWPVPPSSWVRRKPQRSSTTSWRRTTTTSRSATRR